MENGTRLVPLFERVLLKRPKLATLSGGSIIIPDDAARRLAPNKGTIVAIGPNCEDGIEVGKTYIFGLFAGTWINASGSPLPKSDNVSDDAEYFLCLDTDLLAEVIEP